MASSRSDKRKHRALHALQEKGIAITALGFFFLTVPWFSGSSPMLKVIAAGLRMPGWLALGAGLLMLGIHTAVRKKATENNLPLKSAPPKATRSTSQAAPAVRQEPNMEPVRSNIPERNWSPAIFPAIEWRRFEAVCEALFALAGFETRSQSHGADGGVDIWLHSANAQQFLNDGGLCVVGVNQDGEFFGWGWRPWFPPLCWQDR